MRLARTVPDGDDEFVFGIDRHTIPLARGSRKIGIADIRGDLPELTVEGFVDLLPVEHVSHNPGQHPHQRQQAKQPNEQARPERLH